MKKNYIKIVLLAIAILGFHVGAKAQGNYALYYMHGIPQSLQMNPAKKFNYGFGLSLPGISSNFLLFSNDGFNYNDLITIGKDSTGKATQTINMADVADKSRFKNNVMRVNYQVDLLGMYFHFKKLNVNFFVKENIDFRFRYPSGLLNFVGYGNLGANGENKSLQINPSINFTQSREATLGVSYSFLEERLHVGFNTRLLFGILNMDGSDINVQIETANQPNQNYDITFSGSGFMRTSGVINYIEDTLAYIKRNDTDITTNVVKTLTNFGNRGIGFDLGAVYEVNDKLVIDAAILNIGATIKWKTDLKAYAFGGGDTIVSRTFKGVDVAPLLGNSNADSLVIFLKDSLADVFRVSSKPKNETGSYKTTTPVRFNIGTTYEVVRHLRLAGTFFGEIYEGDFRPAFAITADKEFGRWTSLCLSYALAKNSAAQIGGGISINLGPVQTYFVSDNIIGSTLFWKSSKNMSLRFGMNLVFGYKDKRVKRTKANKYDALEQ